MLAAAAKKKLGLVRRSVTWPSHAASASLFHSSSLLYQRIESTDCPESDREST